MHIEHFDNYFKDWEVPFWRKQEEKVEERTDFHAGPSRKIVRYWNWKESCKWPKSKFLSYRWEDWGPEESNDPLGCLLSVSQTACFSTTRSPYFPPRNFAAPECAVLTPAGPAWGAAFCLSSLGHLLPASLASGAAEMTWQEEGQRSKGPTAARSQCLSLWQFQPTIPAYSVLLWLLLRSEVKCLWGLALWLSGHHELKKKQCSSMVTVTLESRDVLQSLPESLHMVLVRFGYYNRTLRTG